MQKKEKRRIAAVLAAFFCILLSFAAFAETPELTVTYGFKNNARSGILLPVEVKVEVPEGTLSGGYAVVDIPGDTGNLSYTAPVEIISGTGTVRFVVTIPYGYAAGREDSHRIQVRFLNEDGETLSSKAVSINYRGSGKDAFLGLVSLNPEELSWLDHLNLTEEIVTRKAVLSVNDLPDSAAGLSQLDLIVISGVALRDITEASLQAVAEWVRAGGTLILGTGAVGDPLGIFSELAGIRAEGLPEVRDVDLGMQYSVSGPDGAVLSLAVREVSSDDGEVIYETGDLPVFTRLGFGSGRILVTAYDLCDLSTFGTEHPEYASDLIRTALGTEGLRSLSRSTLSGKERQESIARLTNVFEGGLSEKVISYAVIAVWYLALAGGILYLLLKSRGLSIYYSFGVIACAVACGFLVWFVSAKTRIEQPYIHYAACAEVKNGEESAETTLFLDVRRPDTMPITISAPQAMTILPEEASGSVSISVGKTKMLAVTGQKQFDRNLYTVNGREEKSVAQVQLLPESRAGTDTALVRNSSEVTLRSAFALCYNKLYLFGDIAPGELAWSEEVRYCPTAMSAVLAERVLQGTKLPFIEQKQALLQYVLGKRCGAYFDTPLLFAFTDEVPEVLVNTGYSLKGSQVTVFEAAKGNDFESEFSKSVLAAAPTVISGSYDTATNTVAGSGQTVIEYYLGSDRIIDGLVMHPLSEDMAGDTLTAFSGQMAIYNYKNSSFDPMSAEKTVFSAEEMAAWLSPSNSLLVRYTPGGDPDSPVRMFLPVPEAVTRNTPAERLAGGPD